MPSVAPVTSSEFAVLFRPSPRQQTDTSDSGLSEWSVMVRMSASIWVGCQVSVRPFQTGTPANSPSISMDSWVNPRYSMPSNTRPSTRAVSFTVSL